MTIGYDHLNVNFELLLDLLLEEGTGTLTQDWAKPHHANPTLTGAPTWQDLDNGLTYLDFVLGNPDYILILQAASTDLDFTTGDFSVGAWIRPDALGNRDVFSRQLTQVDGWSFWLDTNGAMVLSTNQAGAAQHSFGSNGDIVIGTWVFVGTTRSGASVRIYTNGVDTTATPATHVNPVTANRNLYVGVGNLAGAGWYDRDMWRPRIWGRQLAASEMLLTFNMERDLFGV